MCWGFREDLPKLGGRLPRQSGRSMVGQCASQEDNCQGRPGDLSRGSEREAVVPLEGLGLRRRRDQEGRGQTGGCSLLLEWEASPEAKAEEV